MPISETASTRMRCRLPYLAYEDATLRQYVKFTFATAVFIQSKGRETDEGMDEIDHWIITVGLDGHLISASHDQILEDNTTVLAWEELSNDDKEAVSVAQGIIDRFLAGLLAFSTSPKVALGVD